MNNTLPTAIITSKQFSRHITPWGHPEALDRADVISKALKSSSQLLWIEPRKALLEDLLLCHTEPYIKTVIKEVSSLSPNSVTMLSTGDVTICPDSFEVALLAVGALLSAVDTVMQKKAQNAFCAVRPPGHHATSSCGMGFCLFNNVAIGARYLQKKYDIKRVLIIDWDVHHGNGTQEIFYNDPSVFYFSTHQEAIYPGTGFVEETGGPEAIGSTLNCPISSGKGSCLAIFDAFTNKLLPAMEQFQPEAIFISCGFDAHQDDPLGGLELNEKDFYELTKMVKRMSERWASGRLFSILEGGYNKQALAASSIKHVEALLSPEVV